MSLLLLLLLLLSSLLRGGSIVAIAIVAANKIRLIRLDVTGMTIDDPFYIDL
jgi:hypothetical protein